MTDFRIPAMASGLEQNTQKRRRDSLTGAGLKNNHKTIGKMYNGKFALQRSMKARRKNRDIRGLFFFQLPMGYKKKTN